MDQRYHVAVLVILSLCRACRALQPPDNGLELSDRSQLRMMPNGAAAAALDTTTSGRMPQLANISANCANPDTMSIVLQFDAPFTGLIYAKGRYGQSNCLFALPVNSGGAAVGVSVFNFTASVTNCGSKNVDRRRNLKLSSITLMMQQDPLFIEQTDYAREVRCTWSLRYDKTISLKPFVVTETVKNAAGLVEFSGDELSVMMDVKLGRDPFSGMSLGSAPVSLGTEMTIVVLVKSDTVDARSIDVVVRDCQAREVEKGAVVALTDGDGCVLQPKLITPFRRALDVPMPGVALAAYATLQSFKFPDTPRVSLTCNVALCKDSCGIACGTRGVGGGGATSANNNNNSSTNRRIQQHVVSVATSPAKRVRRELGVSVPITASAPANRTARQLLLAALSQRTSSLEPPLFITNDTTATTPAATTMTTSVASESYFPFRNRQFLDMALLRAKRIILDATTKLHQVQVERDIMVVANTKADSSSVRRRLIIGADGDSGPKAASVQYDDAWFTDPLAARGATQHLQDGTSPDTAAGIISTDDFHSKTGTDVTELQCSNVNNKHQWVIISFLFILLLLLLAIVVVMAMFVCHYRGEAREAQRKYKLYGAADIAATPATYYVASTSPTYQLYTSDTGGLSAGGGGGLIHRQQVGRVPKMRTSPTKPSRAPSLPPSSMAGGLAATEVTIHHHQQQHDGRPGFDTWTQTHPEIVRHVQLHTEQQQQQQAQSNTNNTNASLASRSLCRSLPSLAGAFPDQHQQLMSLMPISAVPFDGSGGDQQDQQQLPLPPAPVGLLDVATMANSDHMLLHSHMPQTSSLVTAAQETQQQSHPHQHLFEDAASNFDESRSMISSSIAFSEQLRSTTVSTFRPSSLADRHTKSRKD